ncbi:thioesterase family protein [Saccharopolyspora erythraea]|uniref:acyl-CoA thioesterase n=1 Tax=Saccharopolyspora erythraea TaxID=1836 RepID=UPI001BAD326C|nr:acyl-CoA thioesterase domain-containing protein [Saccharopolyspora erythraea]QUH04114.1 thioesterase family protein [Saccharopolyspora erythraea]
MDHIDTERPDAGLSGDETSLPGVINRTPLADRIALRREDGCLEGSPVAGFDQRVFGGHLLAQLVLAAGAHAPARRVVESLHVCFLRPGRPDESIAYQVRTVRTGRTRTVLAVGAEQSGRELVTGLVSLGPGERNSSTASVRPPQVPEPESLPSLPQRRTAGLPADGVRLPPHGDWRTASRPLDVRPVDDPSAPRCLWLRADPVPGADSHLRRAVLAFASDRSLVPVIARDRGERAGLHRPAASADHAMWFHTDSEPGNWLLYVQDCPAAGERGGLARGTLFERDGRVVASVAQHAVLLD